MLFTFGILFTGIRVDQKKLIYLHKILNRDPSHWTRKSLDALGILNIGWYKNIHQTLTKYNLPEEFSQIQIKTANEWRNMVKKEIKNTNRTRLIKECHKQSGNESIKKAKTAHIIDKIKEPTYTRQPQKELKSLSKQETKTLIIARFGMLECGKNYKGTMSELCSLCSCIDDEEHRMNICPKYDQLNFMNNPDGILFSTIYSDNIDDIKSVIEKIETIWDVNKGHGSFRKLLFD